MDRTGSIGIIAFPFHDWRKSNEEGFRTRDGHLMQAFARSSAVDRVLVIDRPVSLAERLRGRLPATASGRVVERLRVGGAHGTLTETPGGTIVLDIAVRDVAAPVRDPRRWWFDVFARESVERIIDDAAAATVGAERRVIAWVPTVAPAVLALKPARSVYDSLDNWLIHPVLRRHEAQARGAYARLLPAADRVFASGPGSAQILSEWCPSVTVLPNGVDLAPFQSATDRPPDLPNSPVVGYAGKLAERIDVELVRAVAMSLPAVSFVFVGPVLDKSVGKALRGQPNVILLGDRPYASMPAYMGHFDVAWIPHRVGEGETGGDPIKLYEYWAAGRQVVSTAIDGMSAWREQVHVVADAEAATAVLRGLLDGSIASKPVSVPPDRTWDAIANVLIDALADQP